jgi:DNA-binding HxlR family transcriptional regulator
MFKNLDPILNSQVRLAIISILMRVKSADFIYLKEHTETTQGNLSHQLKKLKEANYVEIIKSFKNNYPHTSCKITAKGRDAFEKYVEDIKGYLNVE